MRNLDRAFAAVAALRLNGANKQVAAHWLSRWQNDAPPARERFTVKDIWEFNPAIAIFEMREDAVVCVSSGSFHKLALGYDLTGQDILSITDAAERPARLTWCRRIVEGAVTVSYRTYESRGNSKGMAQGVSLPLGDAAADGARSFLMHTNWRPVGSDWMAGNVHADAQIPPKRQIVSFRAEAQSAAA